MHHHGANSIHTGETREKRENHCEVQAFFLGPPNVGKTSLFNAVSGKKEKISKWPGSTVIIKEAQIEHDGTRICLTDLPGIYSLSYQSDETYIIKQILTHIDLKKANLLLLIDPTVPEKSIYLALELMELGIPFTIIITKEDVLEKENILVNVEELERFFGVRALFTSIKKKATIDNLKNIIKNEISRIPKDIEYKKFSNYIKQFDSMITCKEKIEKTFRKKGIVLKYLENDSFFQDNCRLDNKTKGVFIDKEAIVEERYKIVEELTRKAFSIPQIQRISKIDSMFFNPWTGLPLSLAILFGIFFLAFSINLGFPLQQFFSYIGVEELSRILESYNLASIVDKLLSYITIYIQNELGRIASNAMLSFLTEGIIGGIGALIVFLPLISIIMLFFAALEDSGLATRIALSMDPFFKKLGLSGKAIYPTIVSMGCNVPGIISSRIIENKRIRTALIAGASFIPCQARLVVLTAFAAAFLYTAVIQTISILLIYITGIILYLITAKIILNLKNKTDKKEYLLMELPELSLPNIKAIVVMVEEVLRDFLKKVGTIILLFSIVFWFFSHFSPNLEFTENTGFSMLGILSQKLSFTGEIYGVPQNISWKIVTSLIVGFFAKELVLSTLVILTPGAQSPLTALSNITLTTPQALALMLFIALYIPCLPTAITIYNETRKKSYFVSIILLTIVTAFFVSFVVYKTLSLFN